MAGGRSARTNLNRTGAHNLPSTKDGRLSRTLGRRTVRLVLAVKGLERMCGGCNALALLSPLAAALAAAAAAAASAVGRQGAATRLASQRASNTAASRCLATLTRCHRGACCTSSEPNISCPNASSAGYKCKSLHWRPRSLSLLPLATARSPECGGQVPCSWRQAALEAPTRSERRAASEKQARHSGRRQASAKLCCCEEIVDLSVLFRQQDQPRP